MHTIAVILARAGSNGLPNKCVLPVCGVPMISYTIGHAKASRRLDAVVLSTDSLEAARIGRSSGVLVVDRPGELATDGATVVSAVGHAVEAYEQAVGRSCDAVVILYGNIPVRAEGGIDQCIERLYATGCDSIRTVVRVSKQHPDWLHRLEDDRMVQFRRNSIDRRQDLEPVYYHNGAVIVVRRDSLFLPENDHDPHAFFGKDRRAVVQKEEDAVDVDTLADLYMAEAMIRANQTALLVDASSVERSACAEAVPFLQPIT